MVPLPRSTSWVPGVSSVASIEGVSALLPDGAQSLAGAQAILSCGADAITEVPASRWNLHTQPALSEPVASRVRHLGYVRDAELADNALFGVSSSETLAMDPCQRLVLERGYAALHDTALGRSALIGSLTGTFLGFAGSGFDLVLAASPAGSSVYAATGSSLSIASGRVSYVLGLNGPCVSYDTACSAALVASHAGKRAMQFSECTAGVVVGTTLMLSPVVGTTFAVAGMTSPRGRCHTFDTGADGYARGEATGAAVMRSDAGSRNGELLGSAVRQDGRSASLTAPSGQAQGGLIKAAFSDASISGGEIALNEAHGTGTALGDPIEAGSLVAATLSTRGEQAPPVAVGGVKANIGHAEPAAGITGLLKLVAGMLAKMSAPNAQLRALNPMVSSAFHDVDCALVVQPEWLAGDAQAHGGVSSFGYSGTIAHAILRQSMSIAHRLRLSSCLAGSKRRAFAWLDPPHPFTQRRLPLRSDGAITFRSPAAGALHGIVADHVVQGRIIFPAVGYLEMARSAVASEMALQEVFFMRPLAVEIPGLLVECTIIDGRFDVRSGENDDALTDSTGHCTGAFTAIESYYRGDLTPLRATYCARVASIKDIYVGFWESGLHYGRGFRTLVQAWGGANHGVAKLQARSTMRMGAHVHPADLDDALCTLALMDGGNGTGGGKGETRLPFSVSKALLQATTGQLWAVCRRDSNTNAVTALMLALR